MIRLHNLENSRMNGLITITFPRWIGHAFVRLTSKNSSTDEIHASNALRAQRVSSAKSSNHTCVPPRSSIYQGLYIYTFSTKPYISSVSCEAALQISNWQFRIKTLSWSLTM